jgi:hypothetical protein
MFLFIFQGKVKVVRVQSVINTEQENKLLRGSTEDLGCSKASSHADGMYICICSLFLQFLYMFYLVFGLFFFW